MVRLDGMALAFKLQGSPDPVHIESSDQFSEVIHARCPAPSANVLFGPQQSLQIVHTCRREWGHDAYSVEVGLAFAWLSGAPIGNGGSGTEPLLELAEQLREKMAPVVGEAGETAQ